MKRITTILLFLLLFSCSSIKPIQKEWLSMIEIKKEYGLTNQEFKKVIQDAKIDSIAIKYHAGRDEWLYDAKVDYNKYLTE